MRKLSSEVEDLEKGKRLVREAPTKATSLCNHNLCNTSGIRVYGEKTASCWLLGHAEERLSPRMGKPCQVKEAVGFAALWVEGSGGSGGGRRRILAAVAITSEDSVLPCHPEGPMRTLGGP